MGVENVNERMTQLSRERKLVSLLEGTLAFYTSPWNDDINRVFKQRTSGAEPSTKGLCDAIRKGLAELGYDLSPELREYENSSNLVYDENGKLDVDTSLKNIRKQMEERGLNPDSIR